jgi:hypothetical protein
MLEPYDWRPHSEEAMPGWQRASWTFAGAAVIAVGAIVVVRDLRARADARAAAAAFEPVIKVLQSPRCMNCHTRTSRGSRTSASATPSS